MSDLTSGFIDLATFGEADEYYNSRAIRRKENGLPRPISTSTSKHTSRNPSTSRSPTSVLLVTCIPIVVGYVAHYFLHARHG